MTRSVTDGLASVESSVRNAAIAVGFGPWRRFWTVDFPLAGPVMLAGLRVTAVSTISLATVGALIGVQNLGYLFTNGSQRRILPEVFAGVLAVVIIALVIDALLLQRDHTIARMKARERRLAAGWLEGRTQKDLATEERIAQSAVSQTLHRSGAIALAAGIQLISEVTTG